eukprot:gene23747-40360_t
MIGAATHGVLRSFGEGALRGLELCRCVLTVVPHTQLEGELREEVDSRLQLDLAAPKRRERAFVKARIKYGLDCSRLCDLNRATLRCPDIAVIELEDRYQDAMPGGYCHVQLLVLLSGALQLNTEPMLRAKDGAGH